jgi:hypothetical protein
VNSWEGEEGRRTVGRERKGGEQLGGTGREVNSWEGEEGRDRVGETCLPFRTCSLLTSYVLCKVGCFKFLPFSPHIDCHLRAYGLCRRPHGFHKKGATQFFYSFITSVHNIL